MLFDGAGITGCGKDGGKEEGSSSSGSCGACGLYGISLHKKRSSCIAVTNAFVSSMFSL